MSIKRLTIPIAGAFFLFVSPLMTTQSFSSSGYSDGEEEFKQQEIANQQQHQNQQVQQQGKPVLEKLGGGLKVVIRELIGFLGYEENINLKLVSKEFKTIVSELEKTEHNFEKINIGEYFFYFVKKSKQNEFDINMEEQDLTGGEPHDWKTYEISSLADVFIQEILQRKNISCLHITDQSFLRLGLPQNYFVKRLLLARYGGLIRIHQSSFLKYPNFYERSPEELINLDQDFPRNHELATIFDRNPFVLRKFPFLLPTQAAFVDENFFFFNRFLNSEQNHQITKIHENLEELNIINPFYTKESKEDFFTYLKNFPKIQNLTFTSGSGRFFDLKDTNKKNLPQLKKVRFNFLGLGMEFNLNGFCPPELEIVCSDRALEVEKNIVEKIQNCLDMDNKPRIGSYISQSIFKLFDYYENGISETPSVLTLPGGLETLFLERWKENPWRDLKTLNISYPQGKSPYGSIEDLVSKQKQLKIKIVDKKQITQLNNKLIEAIVKPNTINS